MKILLSILCSATLVVPVVTASAQNTAIVAKEVQPMSAGEKQLLEMVIGNNFNAFIDSTDISSQFPTIPSEVSKTPMATMILLSTDMKLSSLQFNPTSFLFWKEPDSEELAKMVGAGQGYGPELGTFSQEIVEEMFDAYLDERGQPDEDTGFYTFKWAELPEGLQQQLATRFFSSTMGDVPLSFDSLWLDDALWQKANVYYVPADPRVMHMKSTLVATCRIDVAGESRELHFSLLDGGANASPYQQLKNTDDLKADQIRVWPFVSTQNQDKPAVVTYSPRKAGSAAAAVTAAPASIVAALPQDDPQLATTVLMKTTRLPLSELVARLAGDTKTNLSLSPEVAAENYIVSTTISGQSLSDTMSAIAQLYDLNWKRGADNSYRLEPTTRSEFQTTLHRLGNLSWYRFREASTKGYEENFAAFNELAARVEDEAGPDVLKYPGVAFASLPPKTGQALQARVRKGQARRILQKQISIQPLLEGEWSFTYKPKEGTLTLNVGEKPTQSISLYPPVRQTMPYFPIAPNVQVTPTGHDSGQNALFLNGHIKWTNYDKSR